MLGQHRSTQRKVPRGRPDEDALTADIIALASEYGRYGYRRITALLRDAGWVVNGKRVERRAMVSYWSEDNGERRREGLKVPVKQPKKGRLWLNDGSCVRLPVVAPLVRATTGDGPSTPTMSGATTSCTAGPTMAKRSGP